MNVVLVLTVFTLLSQQCVIGLHFVALGDWGDNLAPGFHQQKTVAQAIDDWCGTHFCDFILTTGDNFYFAGVTSAKDPRFNTSWGWVYNLTNIKYKQWYITIGNHDHGPNDGRERYQIEFWKTEPRWYCPSRWYDVHLSEGATKIHLIVLDSESLYKHKNDPDAQLSWLDSTLAGSAIDEWQIVVSHHPPYSVGDHGPAEAVITDHVLPICLRHGVDVYLSGHEHNLEHISPMKNTGIDYVISGAGGRSLFPKRSWNERILNKLGLQLNYFGYHHGFVAFEFQSTSYTAFFIDKSLSVTYSYSRIK